MIIDVMTLFPEMCEAFLSQSIIGRARKKQILDINCHQIRDFAFDKHKRVDDTPYGGGQGMLMLAEPIYLCFKHICMLFVDKEYHKKGIGKKLVEIAINICKSCNNELKTVTVNSSPYAVEFYHKIGFKDIENEKIEDGIRFTPMSYNLV